MPVVVEGRAVVRVAVQVLAGADRLLPEWLLASAVAESELASVEQVGPREPVE